MPKSSNQKLKILYLAKLFVEQTDEEHPLTVYDLIKRLDAAGIPAERKSIYDDIEALRLFGLDIVTQKSKTTGYYLACRTFDLPEVKLLVDLVQSSKFITGKKSVQLIKKLESLASCHEASQLQRQVYLAGRVKTMNESIYYSVDAIHRAIAENCKIKFQYFDYDVTKQRRYRHDGLAYSISPWALTWNNENYYLVGYDSAAEIIKNYRVDRMEHISQLDQARDGADAFAKIDMGVYSRTQFSMFAGREETVKIRFPGALVGVVLDHFGRDTMLIPDGDAAFTLSERVAVSPQFFGWLAGLGREVKILSPEGVRNDYYAHLRSLLE